MHAFARLSLLLPIVLLAGCAGHLPARNAGAGPAATFPSCTTAHDPRLRASVPRAPAVPSPVAVPLDAMTLSSVPRRRITARAAERTLHCEGVPLFELLRATGSVPAGPLHGPQLSRYVLAQARDGRRVLFSLAELDPAPGGPAIDVVDRCNGDVPGLADAPLLLVDGDLDDARSLSGLHTLTVVVAP
ncbi:hypothetical protein E5843_04145 [Luteimonas yindakuii]|uniref:hypothetical protein n=1 Tax=Luteimonas yindakuii TaxID=2565782 RepID=UPI0010A565F0|nr:hypothetical protein [Luteimonas yindakuii]QCO67171.1 hypothetical protein E5843_04145 [Luteimonas yindakuii]